MPVALVEPSHHKSGQYERHIRYAAFYAELLHAVPPHERVGYHACRKRNHKAASASQHAAYQYKLHHVVGKEIKHSGRKVDGKSSYHDAHLVARFGEFAGEQHEGYYQQVRQHREQLDFQVRCMREYSVEVAEHGADGQPRKVDHQRHRPYCQQSRQCDGAFSGGYSHGRIIWFVPLSALQPALPCRMAGSRPAISTPARECGPLSASRRGRMWSRGCATISYVWRRQ